MNEVAKIDRPKPPIAAGGTLAALIPQNVEEAFRLAGAVHHAGIAPRGMDQPEKILIAILTGLEVGVPPMQAVQGIAIINNRPCMWGDTLLGVVRATSRCEYVKEWLEGEGDAMVAYCETRRRGEDEPITRNFSMADARRAGLAKKTGPWQEYPKRMLQMRARAFCLRDAYADVLKGIQSREEVEDYGPETARDVTPKQVARNPLNEREEAHVESDDGRAADPDADGKAELFSDGGQRVGVDSDEDTATAPADNPEAPDDRESPQEPVQAQEAVSGHAAPDEPEAPATAEPGAREAPSDDDPGSTATPDSFERLGYNAACWRRGKPNEEPGLQEYANLLTGQLTIESLTAAHTAFKQHYVAAFDRMPKSRRARFEAVWSACQRAMSDEDALLRRDETLRGLIGEG